MRSVQDMLTEARRVLAEDVSPGPWQAGLDIPEVANNNPDPRLVWSGSRLIADCRSPFTSTERAAADARVLAAARSLLVYAIEAVEDCETCGAVFSYTEPTHRCCRCETLLRDIKAATGQE